MGDGIIVDDINIEIKAYARIDPIGLSLYSVTWVD